MTIPGVTLNIAIERLQNTLLCVKTLVVDNLLGRDLVYDLVEVLQNTRVISFVRVAIDLRLQSSSSSRHSLRNFCKAGKGTLNPQG